MAQQIAQPAQQENKKNCDLVFATDFVYFVARENRVKWIPDVRPFYYFHYFSSPLTLTMRSAIRIILDHNDVAFNRTFEDMIQLIPEVNVVLYLEHCKGLIDFLVMNNGSIGNYFGASVYIAKTGIMFFKRGVNQAPHLAVNLIHELFNRFNGAPNIGVYRALVNYTVEKMADFASNGVK